MIDYTVLMHFNILFLFGGYMSRILILGYFGLDNNQLDGQTVKTRSVKELFDIKLGEGGVRYFDTQSLRGNKLIYIKLACLLLWCDRLIYLPGVHNLLRLSWFLDALIRIKGLKVCYLVVGGWLDSFLVDNPRFVSLLRRFDYIGVESSSLMVALAEKHGLSNVDFFPNFRIHDFVPSSPGYDRPLKLVFMARVMKEKGIDLLFEAAEMIESEDLDVEIMIYGPVDDKDNDYFFGELEKFSIVKYGGILEPENVHVELSKHDALVLLTRYEGEGFPGSILDAYISGIPVLVSDWKFLPEFVENGKTGFVVKDMDDFYNKINLIGKEHDLLLQMKQSALRKSYTFSGEAAWKKIEREGFGREGGR